MSPPNTPTPQSRVCRPRNPRPSAVRVRSRLQPTRRVCVNGQFVPLGEEFIGEPAVERLAYPVLPRHPWGDERDVDPVLAMATIVDGAAPITDRLSVSVFRVFGCPRTDSLPAYDTCLRFCVGRPLRQPQPSGRRGGCRSPRVSDHCLPRRRSDGGFRHRHGYRRIRSRHELGARSSSARLLRVLTMMVRR